MRRPIKLATTKFQPKPVVEEPKVEETPVVEEPKVEVKPVVEEPKVEKTPVVEEKVEETPKKTTSYTSKKKVSKKETK